MPENRTMAEQRRVPAAEEAARPRVAVSAPSPATAGERVLALQRSLGNRAVGRLLQRETATAQSTWDAAELEALVSYSRAREAGIAAAESPGDADLKSAAAAAKREAIVKLALSQVGKVLDQPGPDGFKIGWERLREFYRVACPSYKPQYDWGIKTVNMWAGQEPGDDPKTDREGLPWSWCAIFSVWAINAITGIGKFNEVPIGLGPPRFLINYGTPLQQAQQLRPGDMICRKEEWQQAGLTKKPEGVQNLNHQCLVASVDLSDENDPQVTTVNGNGIKQAIYERTESVKKYWGFYRLPLGDVAKK
jgi:hypothetical protein